MTVVPQQNKIQLSGLQENEAHIIFYSVGEYEEKSTTSLIFTVY